LFVQDSESESAGFLIGRTEEPSEEADQQGMRPSQWIARILVLFGIALTISGVVGCGSRSYAAPAPPVPLPSAQNPVAWWSTFKFNTANFPGCKAGAARVCPFGG
jgi:hypothetical protein